MQRRTSLLFGFALGLSSLAGCGSLAGDSGWTTLLDGSQGLENWNRVGDANWRAEGGAIVADRGKGGFLVSKAKYRDFAIRAEFWAETDTNSGIFVRATDPVGITADNAYEVNIWDIRPDPKYATGGIVNHAAVPVPLVHKAGGRWNTFEIEARGSRISVKLNGLPTAAMDNAKLVDGPFALQFGAGVQGVTGGPIRWRKVQIRPL